MPPDRDGRPGEPAASASAASSAKESSLSVADTNALRASLGLPPLREGPALRDQAAGRRAAAAVAAAADAAAAEADAIAARVAACVLVKGEKRKGSRVCARVRCAPDGCVQGPRGRTSRDGTV